MCEFLEFDNVWSVVFCFALSFCSGFAFNAQLETYVNG